MPSQVKADAAADDQTKTERKMLPLLQQLSLSAASELLSFV